MLHITSLVLIRKVNAQRMFVHNFLIWVTSTHKRLPKRQQNIKKRKQKTKQKCEMTTTTNKLMHNFTNFITHNIIYSLNYFLRKSLYINIYIDIPYSKMHINKSRLILLTDTASMEYIIFFIFEWWILMYTNAKNSYVWNRFENGINILSTHDNLLIYIFSNWTKNANSPKVHRCMSSIILC